MKKAENADGTFRVFVFPNYFTDLDEPPEVYWDEMRKWRPDFLADWESRWAWYD